MKRFLKELVAYVSVTAIVIAVLIFIQPAMIRRLPNDFSRHGVIIDALKDSSIKPRIIFFGNSLSMFGINSHTVSNNLPGKPVVYNLSSVGQAIFEGAYFLSSVPGGTTDVFQCLDYITFTLPNTNLHGGKAMSMALNGYHLDTTTRSLLININPVFYQPQWLVSFDARGNLRSSLHNYLRKYLDNEEFDTNFHDRYFPHIYLTDRHPSYPNLSIDISYDSLPVSDSIVSLASRINNYFLSRGIRYHLVMMPINHEIFTLDSLRGAKYIQEVRSRLPGVDIIDLSNTLNPAQFYDAIHANKKGAETISVTLADHLRRTAKN